MQRPNILFIYADDHASHAISAYGSRINETPNIDRLATEGMLFRNCFVGNSICAPARATVLTGLLSHANGVIDNSVVFDGAQRTFPKLLQAVGYQTALIGKWHLKSDPTGFDHWQVLIGQGPYYNPPMKTPEGTGPAHRLHDRRDHRPDALEWLEERPRPGAAVHADVPAQGAAPRVGAGPGSPEHDVRRRHDPRAADPVRRLVQGRSFAASTAGDDDRGAHERRAT